MGQTQSSPMHELVALKEFAPILKKIHYKENSLSNEDLKEGIQLIPSLENAQCSKIELSVLCNSLRSFTMPIYTHDGTKMDIDKEIYDEFCVEIFKFMIRKGWNPSNDFYFAGCPTEFNHNLQHDHQAFFDKDPLIISLLLPFQRNSFKTYEPSCNYSFLQLSMLYLKDQGIYLRRIIDCCLSNGEKINAYCDNIHYYIGGGVREIHWEKRTPFVLLAANLDVNHSTQDHLETFKLLILRGADPYIADSSGRHVLHFLARYSPDKSIPLLQYLFENTERSKITNNASVINEAVKRSNYPVAKYLYEAFIASKPIESVTFLHDFIAAMLENQHKGVDKVRQSLFKEILNRTPPFQTKIKGEDGFICLLQHGFVEEAMMLGEWQPAIPQRSKHWESPLFVYLNYCASNPKSIDYQASEKFFSWLRQHTENPFNGAAMRLARNNSNLSELYKTLELVITHKASRQSSSSKHEVNQTKGVETSQRNPLPIENRSLNEFWMNGKKVDPKKNLVQDREQATTSFEVFSQQ